MPRHHVKRRRVALRKDSRRRRKNMQRRFAKLYRWYRDYRAIGHTAMDAYHASLADDERY